jgi:hypothetical protein
MKWILIVMYLTSTTPNGASAVIANNLYNTREQCNADIARLTQKVDARNLKIFCALAEAAP